MEGCIKCGARIYSCKFCKKHYREELKKNRQESKWLKKLRFQNTFIKIDGKVI